MSAGESMAKRVTLRQIGERAGVSSVAVGAALGLLSDSSRVRLSTDRAREIRRIADQMGYQRNQLARAFRKQRTQTIGVLFRVVSSPQRVSYMVDCIARGLAGRGYRPNLAPFFGRFDTLQRSVQDLIGWRVDGLIFTHLFASDDVDGRWPELEQQVHSSHTPMVFVESDLETFAPCHQFNADLAGAVTAAAQRLLARGHRRLAYIGTASSTDGLRFAAVRDVVSQHHGASVIHRVLEPAEDVHPIHELAHPAQETGRTLTAASTRPTAVICGNDSIAAGVIAGALDAGLKVPEELAVIGYDNSEQALLCRPQISSFEPPIEQLASDAIKAVFDQIERKDIKPGKHLFPARFVERSSG